MTKKKLLILLGIVLVVVFIGYTSFKSNETTTEFHNTWKFTEDKIKSIELTGLRQNINITYTESEDENTYVKLSGPVSEKTKKELEESVVSKNHLHLTFNKEEKLQFMVHSEDSEYVTLEISLGHTSSVETLKVEAFLSDVTIKVPADFSGTYETEARNGGKVKVPKTKKESKQLIQVDTVGNITISK